MIRREFFYREFWLYVWQAPTRWTGFPNYRQYRSWSGLNKWTVRWCRLRGHPGMIFYNPGGLEPDTRCERCLEEMG